MTAIIERSYSHQPNFELYGNVYGCAAGVFEYRCNFCSSAFDVAIDFERHVLGHFQEVCIPVLLPKNEENDQEECDLLIAKEEPSSDDENESIDHFDEAPETYSVSVDEE